MEALSSYKNQGEELIREDELNITNDFGNHLHDDIDVSQCNINLLTSDFDAEDTSNIQYWDSPSFSDSVLSPVPEDRILKETVEDLRSLLPLRKYPWQQRSLHQRDKGLCSHLSTLTFQWLVRMAILILMKRLTNLHYLRINSIILWTITLRTSMLSLTKTMQRAHVILSPFWITITSAVSLNYAASTPLATQFRMKNGTHFLWCRMRTITWLLNTSLPLILGKSRTAAYTTRLKVPS